MQKQLKHIDYSKLNARQKENYNFLKASAILADYGFMTIRLSDDWQGADFIAQHIDGETFLKVQLKGRLTMERKYLGKDLFIVFFDGPTMYMFPRDEVVETILHSSKVGSTKSWERGGYSFPNLSKKWKEVLAPYKVGEYQ